MSDGAAPATVPVLGPSGRGRGGLLAWGLAIGCAILVGLGGRLATGASVGPASAAIVDRATTGHPVRPAIPLVLESPVDGAARTGDRSLDVRGSLGGGASQVQIILVRGHVALARRTVVSEDRFRVAFPLEPRPVGRVAIVAIAYDASGAPQATIRRTVRVGPLIAAGRPPHGVPAEMRRPHR